MLPYSKQSISEEDIAAVVDVLRSEFLTSGPKVVEFEESFAAYVGAKHAVACSSGTAALHLAMLAADIKPGDRVVTSPITFLASANCVAYVGATPDFCDIDSVSYNLNPVALEADWKRDTKAVVAVDYAGQPADMPTISAIARKWGAIVIEDACHGVGGRFFHEGRKWRVGGHLWSDMTVFSFHPVKTLTTGEGGMLVTNNDRFAERARIFRTHGMIRDPARFEGLSADGPAFSEQGAWVYEMQELGYNYRLTDLQCALGLSQLRRLPEFIQRRREIVSQYNEAFADISWLTCPGLRHEQNRELISWHLYSVQIDFEGVGKSRTEVMRELREIGVGSQVLYIPVHLQPWYRKQFGYQYGKCPRAEGFYRRALSLPLFPELTDGDIRRIVSAVRFVCQAS